MNELAISCFVAQSTLPILTLIGAQLPWQVTEKMESTVASLCALLADDSDYEMRGEQLVHRQATIETTAHLVGPMVIGPNCFVAHGALLRGGVILDAGCVVGHGAELKSSVMFTGSSIAHFNFVGDSILGAAVNLEAGVVIANYRNEFGGTCVRLRFENSDIDTGCNKFGAMLGDKVKVGANAVLAPGTIIKAGMVVRRGESVDQVTG